MILHRYSIFILLIFICLSISCKHTLPATSGQSSGGSQSAAHKNSCIIKGKIIEIHAIQPDADTGHVCSKAPCKARLKVLELSQCGSAIANPFFAGDTIEAYFVFSLSPTTLVMPDLSPSYPGLTTGNSFSAAIEERIQPGNSVIYRIYGYQLSD